MKEYLSGSSLISKLQAKHDLLKEAIQKGTNKKPVFKSKTDTWELSYAIVKVHSFCLLLIICLYSHFCLPAEAVDSDPSRYNLFSIRLSIRPWFWDCSHMGVLLTLATAQTTSVHIFLSGITVCLENPEPKPLEFTLKLSRCLNLTRKALENHIYIFKRQVS